MKEDWPGEYQFKHHHRISLDSYNGIAANVMDLNFPIADRFMQVADIRSDIVVIKKPEERVLDYDEIGFVRVGKGLRLPRFDFWRKKGLIHTKKDGDRWLIAVDDQALAEKVRDSSYTGSFNQAYMEAFNKDVLDNGLSGCLIHEKLFNGGRYDIATHTSVVTLLKETTLYPMIIASSVTSGADPLEVAAKAAILYTASHAIYNTFNLSAVVVTNLQKWLGAHLNRGPLDVEYNEPFIRHSIPEVIFMPPFPIDRLIRGVNYLSQHGKEMVLLKGN